MRAKLLHSFILITTAMTSAPALAGVGATSSGVTSTIGSQGTNASADVQQQSSSFVQQNEQLQAAQNGTAANGTPLAAGATNVNGGAKALTNPANGDAGAKPSDSGSGKPGDPATPAAPPTPPPPPPTYVSVVKHITPQAPDGDATSAPPPVALPMPATKPAPAAAGMAKTDPPPVPAKTPAAASPSIAVNGAAANATIAANAGKRLANDHAVEAAVVTGGRGSAPDDYTFYVGLGIAVLLLVFALGTYLSSQKDEAARRSPAGQA